MRLSASQVQLFRNCQRAWAFRYIQGIESPPGPGAVLGGSVHAQLETYLLGGDLDFTTEVGYIAASGLAHLPQPGTPGMRVEHEFHFLGPSGHSYLGYKDVELHPSITRGERGVIIDHKTTSDLRWQKSPETLLTDIQATLYAVDFFRERPNENDVELRWVYYLTRGTKKSAIPGAESRTGLGQLHRHRGDGGADVRRSPCRCSPGPTS
jgi:PD-(D/E)XK nuclease superfamily